ncbi:hypothetical protein ACH495_29265 [Micromonospora sp. NPDC018662]|uniref:hypothetical protein n=1 Tax=Micromonospora sp. NPDC018662 TaxID=3364238 RepID=UPI0037ABA5AC
MTEFVHLMRQAKDRCGYTFRQLEEKAAASGDVLARSTIADVLRRQSLPKPEVLAAFVRACLGPEHVDSWLAARDRLAEAVPATGPADRPPPASPPPVPGRQWWRPPRPVRVALVVLAVLALLGVTVRAVLSNDGEAGSPGPTGSAGPATAGPRHLTTEAQGSAVRVRPAQAPDLCIGEGRDSAGRLSDPVAAQRPCGGAVPPTTVLQLVGGDLYHLKWDHPQEGIGCLTVIDDGPAATMLMPWNDCAADRPAQVFRMEPVDTPVPEGFRIRSASGTFCLGIRDNALTPYAELVQETCTGEGNQEFLIDVL